MTTMKRQTSMLMIFSIYDKEDKYNIEFLENYASINLIPEIKRVSGVGDANVMGTDYSMRIWLKPDVMAQYKLVPSDITGVLAEQNVEAAPGQFGERGNQSFQYTIRYKGRLSSETEFGDIVIKSLPNGELLRLKDVAEMELGRLTYNFNNTVNGHKAVSCIIYQMAGTNATETIANLEKVLAEYEKNLPEGLGINIAQSANDFLFASIHEVVKTLIEAFILVFYRSIYLLAGYAFYVDSGDCHSGSFDCHLLCLEDYRLQYQLADLVGYGACDCDSRRRCHSRRRGCPRQVGPGI